MNLIQYIKRKIFKYSKRGSYIFEAALILPVMIISITVLASFIPAMATFENSVFSACDELRESSIRQVFLKYDVAFKTKFKNRIIEENSNIEEVYIKKYSQRARMHGTDDIMMLYYTLIVDTDNPIGIADSINFDGKVMARAFTGKKTNSVPMGEDEFKENRKSEKVFIFPKSGEKYHRISCKFLNPACKSMCLTNRMKRRWKTCSLCKSEKVQVGDIAFCFPSSGRVYHAGECSTVKKYYVEIEKYYAEKKGYKPCLSCDS